AAARPWAAFDLAAKPRAETPESLWGLQSAGWAMTSDQIVAGAGGHADEELQRGHGRDGHRGYLYHGDADDFDNDFDDEYDGYDDDNDANDDDDDPIRNSHRAS